MVDYVPDPTPHDNFSMWYVYVSCVVWADTRIVTSLSFFSFFFLSFCFLRQLGLRVGSR